MTILGVDLSSNNGPFNFNLGYQQGCRASYLKLGGDNIKPRYVSGSYAGRVDQARAAGMIVGHYWLTGGHDPEAAAEFFVRNLRNQHPSDFFVLDNEKLDDGNMYSDGEAARWIRTVQSMVGGASKRVFMYASGSPLQGSSWAGVRATGAQALVAWYGRAPFNIPMPLGDWPAAQIGGHQYTSGASLGGISPVDLNAFTDNAFDYTTTSGGSASPLTNGNDVFDKDAQDFLNSIAADIKSGLRREVRGRLYYCSTPPAGLPQFVCIFWDRDPVDGRNILYANAGETQVRNWNEVYYQTADTVEQAKKAEMRPDKYAALIEFAKGNDSAFKNSLAS